MRNSEKTDQIDIALEAIQDAIPFIEKTTPAKIEGRGYEFKYKYAPHEEVWELVRPLLKQHRVLKRQSTREGGNASRWMVTRLTHVPSGQWVESEIPMEQAKPGTQNLGAAISYCRRVGLLMAIGTVPKGEDKDAVDEMAGREAKPSRMSKEARSAAAPVEPVDVDQAIADIPNVQTVPDLSKLWASIKGALSKDRREEIYERVKARTAEIKAAQRAPDPEADGR
jgi:hypothetical protein